MAEQVSEEAIRATVVGAVERKPWKHLTATRMPLWMVYLHKQVVLGNADRYRETEDQSRAYVIIAPNEAEKLRFPCLSDIEEVWIVYGTG